MSKKEEFTQIFNFITSCLEKSQSKGCFTLLEATQIVQSLSKLAKLFDVGDLPGPPSPPPTVGLR